MLKWPRFFFAFLICGIALFFPYTARAYYFRAIAGFVHLPFKLFGFISKFILRQLQEDPLFEHDDH